ncbi:hypothetical protein ABT237_30055 [Streptomyces sp. NPDC001581]
MIKLVGEQFADRERRLEITFREHDADARASGEPRKRAPTGAAINLRIPW